ncbi:hypothetical protein TGRH88_080650 [Toxoplasma gondii]|uniref:Uncharacterized protein n=1 Tax=Toxoplasma gondii TaxID=5811 RepID=A0A7J6K5Z8_TOXGO|nr:hypothetical protein TGRH88_080650 [Toxoplasma gondii]
MFEAEDRLRPYLVSSLVVDEQRCSLTAKQLGAVLDDHLEDRVEPLLLLQSLRAIQVHEQQLTHPQETAERNSTRCTERPYYLRRGRRPLAVDVERGGGDAHSLRDGFNCAPKHDACGVAAQLPDCGRRKRRQAERHAQSRVDELSQTNHDELVHHPKRYHGQRAETKHMPPFLPCQRALQRLRRRRRRSSANRGS